MHQQPDITDFEAGFNGAFPFLVKQVVSAAAGHGPFIEEMESMIVFNYGQVDLSTLYH